MHNNKVLIKWIKSICLYFILFFIINYNGFNTFNEEFFRVRFYSFNATLLDNRFINILI